MGFRSPRAAALLKLGGGDPAVTRNVKCPQPTGCGLIEASDVIWVTTSTIWFPQPTGCGLIEAIKDGWHAYASATFPQPTGCGLIEAETLSLHSGPRLVVSAAHGLRPY